MKSKGYYINIVNIENLWHFQLWYNGKQEMGNSIGYENIEECKKALKSFQKFLLNTQSILENENLLKIKKIQDKKFIYVFYDTTGNILYSSRNIETRYNCKKSAISTYKNLPNIVEIERINIKNKINDM